MKNSSLPLIIRQKYIYYEPLVYKNPYQNFFLRTSFHFYVSLLEEDMETKTHEQAG